ncbi:MAG: hypothetical protein JXQ23_06155 [Clostridia bacterium]|nr:hypothetical protein [Clostridia bacterium]
MVKGIFMNNHKDMVIEAKRLRDFYAMKKNAGIVQTEFGFYSLDRWKKEGHINEKTDLDELFGLEKRGQHSLGGLGWCEAEFVPKFDVKLIEDRGEYEVEQDTAGRHVLYFKNRRSGFMPEYIDHPVKDMKSWEEKCKWRMDPFDTGRYVNFDEKIKEAVKAQSEGKVIVLNAVGGYMYLRSLIGPLEVLYKFYDEPELIVDCMKTWFNLIDHVASKYQEYVTIDEFYIGEDICYNHGPLISPEMIREFLFPFYSQVIENVKKRNIDRDRHLYFQLDTDGYSDAVIDLYKEIGLEYLSPFEVASGCDVVRTGKEYPDLLIRGGFDKRILATTKEEIKAEVERILPVMKERGGYIPCCDHGVPEEVSFENYMYFRELLQQYKD